MVRQRVNWGESGEGGTKKNFFSQGKSEGYMVRIRSGALVRSKMVPLLGRRDVCHLEASVRCETKRP